MVSKEVFNIRKDSFSSMILRFTYKRLQVTIFQSVLEGTSYYMNINVCSTDSNIKKDLQ